LLVLNKLFCPHEHARSALQIRYKSCDGVPLPAKGMNDQLIIGSEAVLLSAILNEDKDASVIRDTNILKEYLIFILLLLVT